MSGQRSLNELGKLAADTIRILSAEGVERAKSGHPGMPMGMADCAFVLWSRYLRHNPEDPEWIGRDRFILSAGHGSMLLYSLLYLSGYKVTIDDLKSFRQWGSRTPGHPEYRCLPGVETTTGPLGQGFANGVGMSIAAKMMAARFNTEDFNLFGNHQIYGIVSDGDLMEGISSESASIAGHLKLGNIIYIYDDNGITIEGKTDLAFSENVEQRFNAYGWHTIRIDGHNQDEIAKAIEDGIIEKDRPTLILAKTHIGYGSPNKQDTSGAHGAPLGEEELKAVKRNLDFDEDKEFYVSDEVKNIFNDRLNRLQVKYKEWQSRFEEWQKEYPEKAEQFNSFISLEVPSNIEEELINEIDSEPAATRKVSGKIMQKIADLVPNFCGGSADLFPSNNTYLKKYPSVSPGKFEGRNFHFGIREHAMGGIINGISLYSGFKVFAATFLVFSDYMRPSIRLAALMNLPVIYVFTHDSIFVGEDGPTHQPTEHLLALRSIPNITVIRPADSLEVAVTWAYAIKNQSGPVALVLTRQKVKSIKRSDDFDASLILKGGYIVDKEDSKKADVILVATGSEVGVAVGAKKILSENGLSVRVVSMPSLELFEKQDEDYRNSIVPIDDSKVVVIEVGVTRGWGDLSRLPLLKIGIDRFGASAPYEKLAKEFGFTPEKVAERVISWLKSF
jgi:transketolase